MRRATKGVGLALALLLSTVSAASAQRNLVHQQAPNFVRNDLTGNTISLESYRGKVVLLNFWATWCGPCRVELPGFEAWQQRYGTEGFQVLAVAMDDDAAPVRQFLRRRKLSFPVLLGNARLGEMYGGILGLPTTFLITRDGMIDAQVVGDADMNELERQIRRLLTQPPSEVPVRFNPGMPDGQPVPRSAQ